MGFFSTIKLVNSLEQKKAKGKAEQIAESLTGLDLVILDELAYLPFSLSGGALLFHLLSKLYERASVVIIANLSISKWASVYGDAKMTTALLDRLAHRSPHQRPALRAGSLIAPACGWRACGPGRRQSGRRSGGRILRVLSGGLRRSSW